MWKLPYRFLSSHLITAVSEIFINFHLLGQRCSAGYPELDKQAKVPGCGVRRLGSRVRTLTCRPHTGANEPLTSQPHLRKCDLADLKSLVDGFLKKKKNPEGSRVRAQVSPDSPELE